MHREKRTSGQLIALCIAAVVIGVAAYAVALRDIEAESDISPELAAALERDAARIKRPD